MKILMDAGPWLPVPPPGYGGLENVVATLTTELRARGHTVVLASVGDSTLPVDGLVSAFPSGRFEQLGGPYPQVVGTAHAHEQVVLATLAEHALAGEPFDLVHSHVEVVGPALLAGLGDAAPPTLATLHWDTHRNADFWGSFDGGGRVWFAGVSDTQVAQAPAALREQVVGVVPLSVPVDGPPPVPRTDRSGSVLVLARLCEPKGIDTALRACRAAGVPLVLAGPVGGLPDREALEAALDTPGHPARSHPDVAWFLQHVDPHLDGGAARWIGSVGGAAKEELLRTSRAVLFPIRWEEPGGTAVCEALAAGTPVVAMARGCLPSLVDDGRTGFLATDEAGFTAALERLDEIDPETCAAEARRRFAPAVMADGYERLYAATLTRARASTRSRGRLPSPRRQRALR